MFASMCTSTYKLQVQQYSTSPASVNLYTFFVIFRKVLYEYQPNSTRLLTLPVHFIWEFHQLIGVKDLLKRRFTSFLQTGPYFLNSLCRNLHYFTNKSIHWNLMIYPSVRVWRSFMPLNPKTHKARYQAVVYREPWWSMWSYSQNEHFK